MKKVLEIVLLIILSTEATMATLKQSGMGQARPATQALSQPRQQQMQTQAPQQQTQQMPAWLQGVQQQQAQTQTSTKNKNQLANVTPKRNDALRPTPQAPKQNDQVRTESPAWQNVLSQVIAGVQGAGGTVTIPALMSGMVGQGVYGMMHNKANDQLAPGSPNKYFDKLGRMSGRTAYGPGVGPGTLDPSLWDQSAQGNGGSGYGGGFGSKYKGNWGNGGSGGSGWNYGGGNDYPAWIKTLMGLNSWNIR